MPISEELKKELVKLSQAGKQDDIVSLFEKKLKEGVVTAKEVFDFASIGRFTNKPEKPPVVSADAINSLGLVVESLKNEKQAELDVQFYKLAADRGDSWGSRNYAGCILNKDKKHALIYAKKAVDLTKNNKDEKHRHKFTLCKALRANCKWKEANVALMEYFKFKTEKARSTKEPELKEEIEKEIKQILRLCRKIIDEFMIDFEAKNRDELTTERCRANLEELVAFLNYKKIFDFNSKSRIILQEAYYIKAKCHEKLDEHSEAMCAYCAITDKEFPYYSEVVSARARLLKAQVDKDLTMIYTASDAVSLDKKESLSLQLPSGVPFPAKFGAHWSQETFWFHSVDKKGMKDEFDKRFDQLEQLIAARETEITLIDEFLKNASDEASSFAEKKKNFQEDLKNLQVTKKKFQQKYEKCLPDNRQTFRRYAAESCFFNPKRSKKCIDLIELTHAIIDQRYQQDNSDSPPAPVNLTGKSSRQVISAERAYQHAVVTLTGENNPHLGIPTARTKPWTIWGECFGDHRSGTMGYGPVEHYQMGDTKVQSEHRTSPKRQRLGDSFLPQHASYNKDIYPFLHKLTKENVEKEKQLAAFMIRYGKSHQPVSLEELQEVCAQAEKKDVDHFNGICFLIIEKEQGQWHSATDKRFHLGMSVSQARCLILIEAGFIGFKEAFKNNTLFGIYSQTGIVDNPSEVTKSCQRIDTLYMSYLQNKHVKDHFAFLKKHIDNTAPTCVLTRKQAHWDLKEVYGGDSDTDGEEGYDTDLSV